MAHAPAYPHGPIEEIATDLFVARGCIPLNPVVRISRNMAILRHEGELSLIDPIRLDDEGERRLLSLGTPKRLLRLGPMHGLDDPYYVDRFGLEVWTPGPSEQYPEPKADHTLSPDGALPFPDASLFSFEGTKQAEVALLVRRERGILITCDAIQHYGDYSHNNLPARLLMPFIGFPKTTLVGPVWLKLMTRDHDVLKAGFERLLDEDFDALFAAHGTFLRNGAHEAVERAIRKAFD